MIWSHMGHQWGHGYRGDLVAKEGDRCQNWGKMEKERSERDGGIWISKMGE